MLPIYRTYEAPRSQPMAIASLSISAYSAIARMSREADYVIQQALAIKSRVASMPLLDSGTGRMVNILV